MLMDDSIKLSIPSIILKDIAKSLRIKYDYDIKAHPICHKSAILVIKNNNVKHTIKMESGLVSMWAAFSKLLSGIKIKHWFNHSKHYSENNYVLSVTSIPKDLIVSPINVDICDPTSIKSIIIWVENVISK